jgi:hypothetical protein
VKLRVRPPRPGFGRVGFPWSAPTTPNGVAPHAEEPTTGAHNHTAWARKLPAR